MERKNNERIEREIIEYKIITEKDSDENKDISNRVLVYPSDDDD